MTADNWKYVKVLFAECLTLNWQEREEFLAGQELPHVVRDEVIRLLRNFEKAGDEFLQPPELFRRIFPGKANLLQVGDVLKDRFEIVRFVGNGGMGEVYEARDREIGDTVALKVLSVLGGDSDDFAARFRRELQLARRVTHPNVCRLFDFNRHQFSWGPVEFLTMEYINGRTLAAVLKEQGPCSQNECLSILEQMLMGLQAVHDAGIIHRDLKPGNIMITSGGSGPPRVVVTDFGLAKINADASGDRTLTISHACLGTLAYMAPEQLTTGRVSVRSDLYAVGVIWSEMLHGSREPSATLEIPPSWTEAIRACTHADESQRPATVRELIALLSGPTPARSRVVLVPRTRRSILAVATAASLGGVTLGYKYWSSRRPAFGSGAKLLVADALASDTMLGGPVGVQLRASLQQSGRFTVWDASKLADVWMRMGRNGKPEPSTKDWREIAIRENVRYVLFPSAVPIGDGASLSLRLEELGGNPTSTPKFWQQSFQASDQTHIFEALDDGCRWLRNLAGEADGDVARSSAAPQAVTTPVWAALQEFSRGEERMTTHDRDGAILAFTAATRLDPKFTMAWMRLGDVQTGLGRDNEAFMAWRQAEESARERPLTRREDLRFRSMLASDCADYASAEKLFKEYSSYFPDDWYGPFFRSFPLLLLGRPEEAIADISSCVTFPEVRALALMQLSFDHMYRMDTSQAQDPIRKLRELGMKQHAAWAEAVVAHVAGDIDRATDAVTRAAQDSWLVPRSMERVFKAIVLADGDRIPAALDMLSQGAHEDARSGSRDRWAAKLISIAVLQEWEGSPRAAVASIGDLRRIPCGPEHSGWAGVLFARLGDRVAAGRLLEAIPSKLNYPKFQIPRMRIQAELLLNEGRVAEGLNLLRKASAKEPNGFGCEYYARALNDHGKLSEALAEYRDCLRAKCFQLRLATPAPAGGWYRATRAIRDLESRLGSVGQINKQ